MKKKLLYISIMDTNCKDYIFKAIFVKD